MKCKFPSNIFLNTCGAGKNLEMLSEMQHRIIEQGTPRISLSIDYVHILNSFYEEHLQDLFMKFFVEHMVVCYALGIM